jgi:2'-5' RNA ligase
MPYAVVLYFDDDSTEILKALWRRQAENGISAFMLEEGYRPHITLGACEGLDIASCGSALKEFSTVSGPFTVEMPFLGIFPHDKGAVFLGVTVTDKLLAYHRSFHDLFRSHGKEPSDIFSPGRWIPHCSMAYHESREKDLSALKLNLELPFPIIATCVSLAVIEFPPWNERLVHPLGG